jgi:hypothetical protein
MGAAGSLAARLHELRVQEQIALEHHRAMEKARSEERDRLLDAVLSRPRSLTAPTVVPQTTLALNPLTGSPVGTLAGGNLIMLQGSPLPFLPPPIGLDLVQPQRSPPLVPSTFSIIFKFFEFKSINVNQILFSRIRFNLRSIV